MIDLHAHLFFDELLGKAGELGPRIDRLPDGTYEVTTGGYTWPLGDTSSLAIDPLARVAQLDAAGLEAQVLSLSPLWLFHSSPASLAVPFLELANDLLFAWTQAAPDRLLGFAALPAQDIDAAIAELHRNVARGFVGGYIGGNAAAHLDDPALDPLYAAHVELDVPLFIHSTVPGVDGPRGDSRLERWLGQVTVGYPYEETLTVLSLVLGGVLERHPGLDVLVPHGGGSFPFLAGRVIHSLVLPGAPVSAAQAKAALQRVWFDTHVHSRDSLDLLIETANTERLVFGSNFGGWDTGRVSEVAGMEPLLTTNAHRLLRRVAPTNASDIS